MNNIGLYIHVPFCKNKCPYCDFYSVNIDDELMESYTNDLILKINQWSLKINKPVDTIYFGGGTPSLLGNKRIDKIMNAIYSKFKINTPEVTLEVNPTSLSQINFKDLLKSNVNRLSIGLQSANDNELMLLGRMHSALDAKNTIQSAQKAGFENISLDLMLATPIQNKNSLKTSIEFCKNINAQHISAYLLKIEKGTKYYINKDNLEFKNDDEQSDLYLFACEELEKSGFSQYEISNFCKEGKESKHNLKYWNCDEYLGLGPGAHSFVNGKRFYYERSIKDFMNKNNTIDDGIGGTIEEYSMLQLRLASGLRKKEFFYKFKENIPPIYVDKAKSYEKYDLTKVSEDAIKFTKKGFLLSNELFCKILL